MLLRSFTALLGKTCRSAVYSAVMAACVTMPAAVAAQSGNGQAQACLQLVEVLAAEGRVALDGVSFDFNRASLRPDSLQALVAARDVILTLGGDWHIAGHTDDRGSRDYNQTLSESRAMAVRDWLVGAGVPQEHLGAVGFSFDQPVADNATDEGRAQNRRVELVGMVEPEMLGFGGPEGVDPCPATLIAGTQEDTPPPPPITEWTGTGGQEWLPFSLLMATGYGSGGGWEGDRLTMPPGSQPQACQSLCLANDQCAAFSFEPAGANFIETASCALIGYGTEMNLRRDNGYLDGGVYHASGLKPDAALLTPESEDVASSLLADLAEIARLRANVSITAPKSHAAQVWMDVAVDGAVAGDRYPTYLEITELGDYAFDWQKSKSSLFVHDMTDGRTGQIWVPEPGDYVLRYVINHPTAGLHAVAQQSLLVIDPVRADAPITSNRRGTFEPGIDRPGMDLDMNVLDVADPLACQALCAGDPECQAWTYVSPGNQDEAAICWTKADVPEGYENDCCTSGVMEQASAQPAPQSHTGASLSFPMVVEPGETISVTYSGPLNDGDWIDIIAMGHEDDFSGGLAWGWATGAAVVLDVPDDEGEYTLRYVAEDPQWGTVVLGSDILIVRAPATQTIALTDIMHRCEGVGMAPCELSLPEHDISLSLLPGYGITEPLIYVTPGGAAADRPTFEVVRLSDGEVVVMVNVRQASAPYCQDGIAGDTMCVTDAVNEADGIAVAFVLGSLTSVAMAAEFETMGEDEPGPPVGDLQGVWFVSLNMPGSPEDQSHFVVLELFHDADDSDVTGYFVTAPDVGPLRDLSGDVTGTLADGTLMLTLLGPGGTNGLVFNGTAVGDQDYMGEMVLAHAPDAAPTGAILRKIAGPGEEWSGAPWMTGEAEGMAAAMQVGQSALEGLLGDLDGNDRAMAEIMGALMGAVMGAGTEPAHALNTLSPNVSALGGKPVDMEGIPADTLIELLLPFQSNTP